MENEINFQSYKEFATKDSAYELTFLPGIYLIKLIGASGGYTTAFQVNNPGKGGLVQGIIKIRKTQKLYLNVGSQGTNSSEGTAGQGGYNGGGSGGEDETEFNCGAAGGGGATDLRTVGGLWSNPKSLYSRIMVAGGGGSAGCYYEAGNGGDGGDLQAENGKPSTNSANIVEGGSGGTQNAITLGEGGNGEDSVKLENDFNYKGEGGGGGGGGYYGGQGGKTHCNACSSSGGGGGSSYISGHSSCFSTNEGGSSSNSHIHFSGLYFYNIYIKPGFNVGDGKAIIMGVGNLDICTNNCLSWNYHKFSILFILIIQTKIN